MEFHRVFKRGGSNFVFLWCYVHYNALSFFDIIVGFSLLKYFKNRLHLCSRWGVACGLLFWSCLCFWHLNTAELKVNQEVLLTLQFSGRLYKIGVISPSEAMWAWSFLFGSFSSTDLLYLVFTSLFGLSFSSEKFIVKEFAHFIQILKFTGIKLFIRFSYYLFKIFVIRGVTLFFPDQWLDIYQFDGFSERTSFWYLWLYYFSVFYFISFSLRSFGYIYFF